MTTLPSDKRILHIAAEVAATQDKNVPVLFLGLKDVLSSHIIGTPEAQHIRADLWNYDLTHVINQALKQNFNDIEGAWSTAAQLSTILCSACLGYIPERRNEFKKQFLPDVVDSMLHVAERIQSNVVNTKDALKKPLLQDLRIVLQSLTKLFENYKFLATEVMSAKKYMQLLMTEEEHTCLIMMIFTQNIFRADMNCLAEVSQSRLNSIIDEIVFKIFSTQLVSIASSSIRLLLLCMDLYSPLLELLASRRYRSLRTYLKKWAGRGFDEDIDRLSSILESKTSQQIELMKLCESASLIQSVYRGYATRKKLRRTNAAIEKFHKLYKERKRRKQEEKAKEVEMKERLENIEAKRRNEFISARTKQLKIIENIPAKTVSKFLDGLENEAALKIQKNWRGYKTRLNLQPQLANARVLKAVVTIQRQVRHWLARCRERRMKLQIELLPSGLNDERRVQLQTLIGNMRERFPPKQMTFEELKDMNVKMFSMLNKHVMNLRSERNRELHRKALLAQLAVDSETMLNSPKLNEVTRNDAELLSSRSRPVMAAARRQHNDTTAKLKCPWWQSLGDEDIEADLDSIKQRLNQYGLSDEIEKQF